MGSFRTFTTWVLRCLLLYSVLVEAAPVSDSSLICQTLKTTYQNALYLPSDAPYNQSREENWTQIAWRTPACIFRPTQTQQLQKVIPLLVKNNAKFAIRSGGYSSSPTAANIDDGVLIDLGGFNSVKYNHVTQTAVVGSGMAWNTTYKQLAPFNVSVVGGRVDGVGVGGLTLGSGLSYLSDLYGLACDNVVNHEVILANGTLVNANALEHADLHRALKGGLNNFGVVTRFTLRTYPLDKIWAGIKVYSPSDLPALFEAMYEYQTTLNKDPYANTFLQAFPTNGTIGVLLTLVYLKPVASPPAFSPFYKIKPQSDSTTITSMTEFINGQGPPSWPPRAYLRSAVFKPNQTLYGQLTELMNNNTAVQKLGSLTSGTFSFSLQPISTSLVRAGQVRGGGNSLGLNYVNQTWFQVNTGWWDPKDDDTARYALHDILDPVVSKAEAGNFSLPYIFSNDAGWDQDVIGSYGNANIARLKKTQSLYDPGSVFQTLVPGGFKLPQ